MCLNATYCDFSFKTGQLTTCDFNFVPHFWLLKPDNQSLWYYLDVTKNERWL